MEASVVDSAMFSAGVPSPSDDGSEGGDPNNSLSRINCDVSLLSNVTCAGNGGPASEISISCTFNAAATPAGTKPFSNISIGKKPSSF